MSLYLYYLWVWGYKYPTVSEDPIRANGKHTVSIWIFPFRCLKIAHLKKTIQFLGRCEWLNVIKYLFILMLAALMSALVLKTALFIEKECVGVGGVGEWMGVREGEIVCECVCE